MQTSPEGLGAQRRARALLYAFVDEISIVIGNTHNAAAAARYAAYGNIVRELAVLVDQDRELLEQAAPPLNHVPNTPADETVAAVPPCVISGCGQDARPGFYKCSKHIAEALSEVRHG